MKVDDMKPNNPKAAAIYGLITALVVVLIAYYPPARPIIEGLGLVDPLPQISGTIVISGTTITE